MVCTPFPISDQDLFFNDNESAWAGTNQTVGSSPNQRSASYNSAGTLTITGPNGPAPPFVPGLNQNVAHKFFGNGNFCAVLTLTTGGGNQSMSIIDFTTNPTSAKSVMFLSSTGTAFLQFAKGSGSLCFIGCPIAGGTAGLGIFRSDTGDLVCAGPPPFNPTMQLSAEVVGTQVQMKHGGTIIGGPCDFPLCELTITPSSANFTTVKLGGCPQPPSTKTFTLKNTGTDCMSVGPIGALAPFNVSSTSEPMPTILGPNQSFTATVTFAPGAPGTFNNIDLPVTRSPANGDDKLRCSGDAVTAAPSMTVTPGAIDFKIIQVGETSPAKSVTITNSGDVPITVSVAGSAGPLFKWTGKPATQLDCGASLTINDITFSPTQDEVVEEEDLIVACPQTPNQTVHLKGKGCLPNAEILPGASNFDFGEVRQGYRMPRFITIQNTGDDVLTFSAHISGPDAALFGVMKSQSLTDVVVSPNPRNYSVAPKFSCTGDATGDGAEEVAVVFFANGAPEYVATATLTIDNHNDPNAASSFDFPLTAKIKEANKVDVVAVFDTSGSMGDPVPGGNKMLSAIQGGKLLTQLIPPDLENRVALTRFSTDATTFLHIGEITSANQQSKADAVKNPPLSANGQTAIAAGAMTGLKEFATPHANGTPANLTKAMIVLTDGKDNMAFKNPDDGKFYNILGTWAFDPSNPLMPVDCEPFTPPPDVKVYAIGLGTEQDIDKFQLERLSSGSDGYFGAVDPTTPAVTYQLMKFYTMIYMDLVDTAVIKDPKFTITAGATHAIDFPVLRGDVSATIVMFDIGGWRLPFWLVSPKGEIVDAQFVPAGFQLRSGFTETTRFLDFVLPWTDPDRYAGNWKLMVHHPNRMCRGKPDANSGQTGFVPKECRETKAPLEYGFAIGVGSNFRLNAYLSPQPLLIGDPILLIGVPTEAGLPVTGCSVTVEAVAPNGQTWTGLVLKDDGLHQDGDANDGEYALAFTHTAMPGTYTFTFRATGMTRDGELVHREVVRCKSVQGHRRRRPGGPNHQLHVDLEKIHKLLAELLKRKDDPKPPA